MNDLSEVNENLATWQNQLPEFIILISKIEAIVNQFRNSCLQHDGKTRILSKTTLGVTEFYTLDSTSFIIIINNFERLIFKEELIYVEALHFRSDEI
jgi:hypothetical protein